uniref:F-actin-capping protein subunit alpha n=1 Tax=Arcella intermedia TaxID=1963864 RepID=A0A6B2LDL6_9EUKA
MLNAPPGEFHDVVTDVRALLNNDGLLNDIAADAYREYNTEQMIAVDRGDHKALITKHGARGTDEYWDPVANKVLKFDHFKGEVTEERAASADDVDAESEPYRTAIESKANEYVKSFYDRGAGAVYSAKSGPITFCISSHFFNNNNFYTGRWRSVWTVKLAGGKASLEGLIRIQVHYFEDGNVQLNTTYKKTKDGIPAKDPASLADLVIKQISEFEADYQNQLEINYEKMNNSTFKALRRGLPVTGQKIKWEKISSYNIGGDLNKK